MEKIKWFELCFQKRIRLPIFMVFLLFSISVVSQNIYTVNSTDDTEDVDLADNICADSKGNCTLRAAIQNANKYSEKDRIGFKIKGNGPHTIFLKNNLPPIKETVELNAREQPGFSIDNPQIILNGSEIINGFPKNSQNASKGLWLTGESSGSTIKGFAIVGFSSTCIWVDTDKNNIQGNLIGLTPEGRADFQTLRGIVIEGTDNLIGGTQIEDKNVFSGTTVGIFTHSGNKIMGNYIGTTADGCSPNPNKVGIALIRFTENTLIANNLISGNEVGIHLNGDKNEILNNRIGTNTAGTEKIPNGIGILLGEALNNLIGASNNGNIISGNKIGISIENISVVDQYNRIFSNLIGTDITGNFDLGNETGILIKRGNGNWIGGLKEGEGNLISGNTKFGIEINGSRETIIAGNYIGTDKAGKSAIPNGSGVKLEGDPENIDCFNNIITANLISGNSGDGIVINNAQYNSITGNWLGTQPDGISPLPNGGNGIKIGLLAQNNCVGGPDKNQQNIVKFNRKDLPEIQLNKSSSGILIMQQ